MRCGTNEIHVHLGSPALVGGWPCSARPSSELRRASRFCSLRSHSQDKSCEAPARKPERSRMEAVGIEPTSGCPWPEASTRIVGLLFLGPFGSDQQDPLRPNRDSFSRQPRTRSTWPTSPCIGVLSRPTDEPRRTWPLVRQPTTCLSRHFKCAGSLERWPTTSSRNFRPARAPSKPVAPTLSTRYSST